ncbi:hypothetical protein [Sporosarcina sp. ZBG7A]|uniref:hypothetical protein n=1 Tax=Sporosarcina sp. ZBG7A TaxID=1582223 RepID=UPI00068C3DCC|nr:hypothetical protein [Sporosarcina sp. ZBG7A]
MSIHKYIKDHIELLGAATYTAPSIPDKKLNGALKSYAEEVELEHVIALKDSSILSTGKEGCLFLGEAVYLKAAFEKPIKLEYGALEKAAYWTSEKAASFGKVKNMEHVEVTLKSGETIDMAPHLLNVNYRGFVALLNGILEQAAQGKEFVNSSQATPLSEMSEQVKGNYIKLVVNYAYLDDSVIDVEEYMDIMSLIARIDITSSSRLDIRGYMIDPSYAQPMDSLIARLRNEVEESSYDLLSKSLFKDTLYLFGRRNDMTLWEQNEYMKALAESLTITQEEATLMIAAIQNDEDILKYRKNDSQITKSMKDIAAKAAGVGVPLAAVYFTGSVAGLSAAGITSGLATMGFGGIFGFSSMFTGIGALVLVGLGTYQGIKKVSGISDIQNNKQREYMLQAIIRNTQKSLSFLIEDINGISQQLIVEMKKGNENSERIQKLSAMLDMLSRSAKLSVAKQEENEIEKVITMLPAKLDLDRLSGLTNKPTLEKVRLFIQSCYEEKLPGRQSEEALESAKAECRLRSDLTLNEAEDLKSLFDQIEYNKVTQAVFASAATKAKGFFGDRT